MRVLLVQPIDYLSYLDGASKANRRVFELLAGAGHEVHVVGWAGTRRTLLSADDYEARVRREGHTIVAAGPESIVFDCTGLRVATVLHSLSWGSVLSEEVRRFRPEVVVVSEDASLFLLEAALEIYDGPTAYIAHSQSSLPFGPESFAREDAKTRAGLLGKTDAVVTVSRYVQRYIELHGGLTSEAVYFPSYGDGPFPAVGGIEGQNALMINPSSYKGICIFEQLVQEYPSYPFAAVPTWGTTSADRQRLESLPNVELWSPTSDVNQLFLRARVLLVPSLWGEAFGQVVVEAMLRGVPVLASNVGGLPEAKLGVDYLLPVNPIVQYRPSLTDLSLPEPIVPAQDIGRWRSPLEAMMENDDLYGEVAAASRATALTFVSGLSEKPLESILQRVVEHHPRGALRQTRVSVASDSKFSLQSMPKRKKALLARKLSEVAHRRKRPLRISCAERGPDKLYPLSASQERFWMLQALDESGSAYNLPLLYRIRGQVDAGVFRRTICALTERHEILRIRYTTTSSGEPRQVLSDELPEVQVESLAASTEDRDAEIKRALREAIMEPFDLRGGPPWRAVLLRTQPDELIFAFVIHNISFDGWSVALFASELVTVYRSLSGGGPVPARGEAYDYVDYATWQRGPEQTKAVHEELEWWKARLARELPTLDLPFYRPRSAERSYRGAQHKLVIRPEVLKRVKEVGHEVSASLFMVLLAAYKALLQRYTSETDVVVGTLAANRGQLEFENTLGLFTNSLVLRTQLGRDDRFTEVLAKVRDGCRDAFARQAVPIERVLEAVRPERIGRKPLFQTVFVVQNAPIPRLDIGNIAISPIDFQGTKTDLDMEISIIELDDGLEVTITYDAELMAAASVQLFWRRYALILDQIVANPTLRISDWSMVTDDESRELLVSFRGPSRPDFVGTSPYAGFEQAVRAGPEHPAIQECCGRSATYRALAEQARSCSAWLSQLGVGAETTVGVALPKRIEMISTLLGVLHRGATYVPLDAGYPRDRLEAMVKDSGLRLVITDRKTSEKVEWMSELGVKLQLVELLVTTVPDSETAVDVHPEQGAYIVYTSGSTGRPNGIVVSNAALGHYARSAARSFELTPRDRVLQFTSINWDTSAEEIYATLTAGATLVLRDERALDSAEDFWKVCADQRLSVIDLPTAFWGDVLAAVKRDPSLVPDALRLVILGGERLPIDWVNSWRNLTEGRVRLVNTYGCTETTVVSNQCEAALGAEEVSASAPVGSPIDNVRTYVLDDALRPVPRDLVGELYVAGPGVARGYLGKPGLTGRRFLPDPYAEQPGERMYRTGDLARCDPGGLIFFVGRNDAQIKVRGCRVELGEIEAVLVSHGDVFNAAVVAVSGDGHTKLVAYAAVGETETTGADLKSYLSSRLPEYMVPPTVIAGPTLPHLPNGKIDRHRLPEHFAGPGVSPAPNVGDPLESKLLQIWREVLALDTVGENDDFFELGGHSLLALRLISRIERELGHKIRFRTVIQGATIAQMATAIREARSDSESPLVKLSAGQAAHPLYFIPGSGGHVLYLRPLSRALGGRSLYAFQAVGLDGRRAPHRTVPAMASAYVEALLSEQPQGPYTICGHSFGALVAFEVATLLENRGAEVTGVVALDSFSPFETNEVVGANWDHAEWTHRIATLIRRAFGAAVDLPVEHLRPYGETEQLQMLLEALRHADILSANADLDQVQGFVNVFRANTQALYCPTTRINAPIVLIKAQELDREGIDGRLTPEQLADPCWGWSRYTSAGVEMVRTPGDHLTMTSSDHSSALAHLLLEVLSDVEALRSI